MTSQERNHILSAYKDMMVIRVGLNRLRALNYLPDDGAVLLAEDALNSIKQALHITNYNKDNRTPRNTYSEHK